MMINRIYIALFALVVNAAGLWAQTTSQSTMPGEVPPPAVASETTSPNMVGVGLRVSNDFDDNALSGAKKQYNFATVLQPHFSLDMSQSRLKWSVDYQPGFSWNYDVAQYNFRSQAADAKLQYTL